MAGNNTLPSANVVAVGGNLGRIQPSEDGIALLIVGMIASGNIVLGQLAGPFYSPDDASAAGIVKPNPATAGSGYDATKSIHVYKHIKDFYDEAGLGNKLYIMPVAQSMTYDAMVDVTNPASPLSVAMQTIGDDVRLYNRGG